MNLIFRETKSTDVEQLFDVRSLTRENPISRKDLEGMGITPESTIMSFDSGAAKGWVCTDNSKVVGFSTGLKETGEIFVLAVLPEYERLGIGSRLLAKVIDWLESNGNDRIWLSTSSNPIFRSYGFYRSQGWHSSGEINQIGDEILVYDVVRK